MKTLKNLSNNELLEYFNLFNKLNKRHHDTRKYGYDVKFAYHIVRLLNEAEQILTEHTLDLQKNREQLKTIRKGEWKKEQIVQYFEDKERQLEEVYNKSTLRHSPNVEKIKQIYLDCLEIHFGSLKNIVERKKDVNDFITDLQILIDKYK